MVDRTCQFCPAPVPGPHWKICGSIECKRARDRVKQAHARSTWSEEKRLEQRAREKVWRDSNPDRVRARNRAAYLADPAKYAQQRDAWRAANAEKHRQLAVLHQSQRRAAKRSGDARRVTIKEWTKAVRRAGGCCTYCGQRATLTMDHVVPLARGGRHAIGNLTPACEPCNKSKGSLFIMEWRRRSALHPPVREREANPGLAGHRVDADLPGSS